jgi:hippurate hydrolase
MTDTPPLDRSLEASPPPRHHDVTGMGAGVGGGGATGPLPDLASLRAAAEEGLPAILAVRREIHRHPEIGLDLPRTQAVVVRELERLGLEPRLGRDLTSVTALLEGGRPGPTIVLRADMDGLPLHEDSGLDFASEDDGAMHACGHDAHVAMLLGAAALLMERRDRLAGSVLFMFQPGEEGFHGARSMLEEGLLELPDDRPATAAFAIHIGTRYETGSVNYRAGAIYASSDTLRITVRGRGGHASAPHSALDPITVAAEIVLGLQTMTSRRVDVFDPAVVTIAHMEAGTTTNIIPETAHLEGTIRAVSDATRELVHAEVRRLVGGICSAHGAAGEVEIVKGYPVTLNDPGFTALVREVALAIADPAAVHELEAPIMGAEDFSYVLQRLPGSMAFLGARPPEEDPATAPMNHSNRVVFHEPALAVGAALHAGVALRYLSAGD